MIDFTHVFFIHDFQHVKIIDITHVLHFNFVQVGVHLGHEQ